MAAMVFTNLLYLVGAIAAATLVSALIVFRHRKPKSLEAGIELFTLEMQALAPESRAGPPGGDRFDPRRPPRPPLPGQARTLRSGPRLGGGGPNRSGGPVNPGSGKGPTRIAPQVSTDPVNVRRHLSDGEAGAPSPHTEDEPG
jgi:hypothetical protein